MRLVLVAALALWAGALLLLSELRWFSRPRLAERVRPYASSGAVSGTRSGIFSVSSFREVIGRLTQCGGGNGIY